jgi:hypothetical protein
MQNEVKLVEVKRQEAPCCSKQKSHTERSCGRTIIFHANMNC